MNMKQGFAAEERALLRGQQIDASTIDSMLGWFPVAIAAETNSLWWRYLGEKSFTESFFQDSLSAQTYAERQVCHTPLARLDALSHGMQSIAPTAFIFHVSRCGSTLLTQMLASLPQCVVLSEPPVLDAFFRHYHHQPDMPGALDLLRQLVAVLGQKRHVAETHFFIKFDSWHMPWLAFIRQAFPDTPFIFLYREPEAVLASHRRQRGPQMIPGLLDITRLEVQDQHLPVADMDGYAAAVLAALFAAGLEQVQASHLHLLNYAQLPAILWDQLFALFALDCDEVQLSSLKARCTLHSKHRHMPYQGDPPAGESPLAQLEQLEQLNRDAVKQCQKIYDELEKLRSGI
ncbi:sulfotransferase [Undibacterium sp. Di26W]|uniref:sulfotransferase n=1 Tax=Undibacterium sp. Di26W TaxID=3413035 RepID=UPI003BF1052B